MCVGIYKCTAEKSAQVQEFWISVKEWWNYAIWKIIVDHPVAYTAK